MATPNPFLSNASPEYVEQLFGLFQTDPQQVDASWRHFFAGFEFALAQYGEAGEAPAMPAPGSPAGSFDSKELGVFRLVEEYRSRGHLFARTNPVRKRNPHNPPITLERFGLSEGDLDTAFQGGQLVGLGTAPLRDILAMLEATYCGSIGIEHNYLRKPEMLTWLLQRMEPDRNRPRFDAEKKKRILRNLNQAVTFERFLHTKFVGQKRFSLEGAETIIPALDAIIERGAALGVKEFVLGMAHRGRLNVLANIMRKEYDDIFAEFEARSFEDSEFQGDVKYHLGYSSDIVAQNGQAVHLSMMPNPSHLETVDAVVLGATRSKIDRRYNGEYGAAVPILIHGDAAVAGQGVVYETIQMSLLEGYKAGGTVHIVINNQIGFTTNYADSRSSTYCTDVAKVTQSPVFHVNGDDAEAVVYAAELAIAFRQAFQRDVFIDIVCYRRHGHNEGDEPSFTQPVLYEIIKNHPNPMRVYADRLLANGEIDAAFEEQLNAEMRAKLNIELEESLQHGVRTQSYFKGLWEGYTRATDADLQADGPDTAVGRERLLSLAAQLHEIPEGFRAHDKIRRLFRDRLNMVADNRLDWALGELLAYATLLVGENRDQGVSIRLSGQDSVRGTFSHRHAGIFDTQTEAMHLPLNHLQAGQKKFTVWNSLLSEYAVLGFEYGYASVNPHRLVIWEAQFGDFANGAQIIIDQYLAAAETKWQRMNGMVLMLPHGYEGQGPEHSSARLERFLQLCADNNMQVLNCTTPANYFHALRMQFHRPFRVPIVFFTPKKLLRYPLCVSPIEDLAQGRFQPVIDDAKADPAAVRRVVLCSGKLYYDLFEQREQARRTDVALVRLEQVAPLPKDKLLALRTRYAAAADWVWAQEEPRNMGAWTYILDQTLGTDIQPTQCVARKASGSPATGKAALHNQEQAEIVATALG